MNNQRKCTSFQVWGFTIIKSETRLITGCGDSELRIWEIKYKDESKSDSEEKKRKLTTQSEHSEEAEVNGSKDKCDHVTVR